MRTALILILVAVVFGGASGCRSVRRGEPVGRTPELVSVGEKRGRVIYQEHCHRCHPGGEGGLGPSLNDKPLPRFLMKTQVRAGLGVMPGFGEDRISDDDLADLMAYMIALRKAPARN
jgi:mono/diheme cytochrome c family protein